MFTRCCDVFSNTNASHSRAEPLPNTYGDPACQSEYLMPILQQAADILFIRSSYIKKLIEDANVSVLAYGK